MSGRSGWVGLAMLGCLSLPSTNVGAQDDGGNDGTIRGVVTDSTGRPLVDVEVISLTFRRSTRTDSAGRYLIAGVPRKDQLVMARTPGFLRAESIVSPTLDSRTVTLDFRLSRVAQSLDTVRVIARDVCPPHDFDGFECRRRAGMGQFRSGDELRAMDAVYFADFFYGLEGLRIVPVRLDLALQSTTRGRCIAYGYNGRQRTAAERLLEPKDIAAIEYYATYEDVPEAYQRLAWPRYGGSPCALVMYWTYSYIKHEDKQKAKRKRKG